MIHPFRSFSLFALLIVGGCSAVNAQSSENPKIYINPGGERFTQIQFDSIQKANMGKPIVKKDIVKKTDVTEITFEVLALHPDAILRNKWINRPLPPFSLKDLSGKQISNESLRGKIAVLNFWSTTCVPCIQEMPHLSELKSKYGSKNVIFIALASENMKKIERTVANRIFTYTLVPDAQPLFTALGLEGYPFHFVVNAAGIVQAIYSGSRFSAETNEVVLDTRLVEAIDQALLAK